MDQTKRNNLLSIIDASTDSLSVIETKLIDMVLHNTINENVDERLSGKSPIFTKTTKYTASNRNYIPKTLTLEFHCLFSNKECR